MKPVVIRHDVTSATKKELDRILKADFHVADYKRILPLYLQGWTADDVRKLTGADIRVLLEHLRRL